jgi:hypothetical protein
MEKRKNCWLIPTDKPSKLFFNHIKRFEKYQFSKEPFINGFTYTSNYHVYITNDSDIKKGDWFIHSSHGTTNIYKAKSVVKESIITTCDNGCWIQFCRKIILSTDEDLIADDIQSIDDDFLQWFINNPSCEDVDIEEKSTVEIEKELDIFGYDIGLTENEYDEWLKKGGQLYKIIIPSEKHKQESLEEAVETISDFIKRESKSANESVGIMKGAKFQMKRMYSLEQISKDFVGEGKSTGYFDDYLDFRIETSDKITFKDWFENFKKK